MSTQHTRGPYTIGTDTARDAGPGRIHVLAQSTVTNGFETVAIASTVANAKFIVRACNSCDELLAVLRRVQPHLEGQRDRYAKLGLDAAFEDYENLIQAASAAIAKAEGRS